MNGSTVLKNSFFSLLLLTSLWGCLSKEGGKEKVEVEPGAPSEVGYELENEEVEIGGGSNIVDFGEIRFNEKVYKTITITHQDGTLPVLDLQMPKLDPLQEEAYFYKGGEFPGEGGTCGEKIEAGESCDIVIEFFPSSEGPSQREFPIQYNDGIDGGHKFDLTFRGTAGIPAVLEIDEGKTKHEFGLIQPDQTKQATLTLSNDGGLTAKNITVGITGDSSLGFVGGSYPGTGGTCGKELGYGESCTMEISFEPKAEGNKQKDLTLDYEFFSTVKSTDITMTGSAYYARADFNFITSDHTFDPKIWENQGATTFVVQNEGYGKGEVTDVSFADVPDAFEVVTDDPLNPTTCVDGKVLEINDKCEIRVRFKPPYLGEFAVDSSVGGDYANTIQLSYHNGDFDVSDPIEQSVSGEGIIPAFLYFSYSGTTIDQFDYGATGIFQEVTRTFTLNNKGESLATDIDMILDNLREFSKTPTGTEVDKICETQYDNGDFVEPSDPPGCYTGFTLKGTTCGGTLSPGETCNIQISFKARDSTYHILSDDSDFQDVPEPDPLVGLNPFRLNYEDGAQLQQAKLQLKAFGEGRPVISWFPDGVNKDEKKSFSIERLIESSYYDQSGSTDEEHRDENRIKLWVKNVGTDPAYNLSVDAPFGKGPNGDKSFRFPPTQVPFTDDNDINNDPVDFTDGQYCPKNIPAKGYCYIYLEVHHPDDGFFFDNMDVTYVQTTQTNPTRDGVGEVTTDGQFVNLDPPDEFSDTTDPGTIQPIGPGDKIIISGQERYVERMVDSNQLTVYEPFNPEITTPTTFEYIKSNARYNAELGYDVRVDSLGELRATPSPLEFGKAAPNTVHHDAVRFRNIGENKVTNVTLEIVDDSSDNFSYPPQSEFDAQEDYDPNYKDCRDNSGSQEDTFEEMRLNRRCNLPVRFEPDDFSPKSARLKLTYDDGLHSAAEKYIDITGEGWDMANMILQTDGDPDRDESPSPSATVFEIDDTIIGTTGVYKWKIRNNGTQPAEDITFGSLGEKFTIDPSDGITTCSGTLDDPANPSEFTVSSLAVGDSCVIGLRFSDNESGYRQKSIAYSFDDGDSITHSSYTVQVRSTTAGKIEVDPASYDFGRTIIDTSSDKYFRLSNKGDTDVSLSAANINLTATDPYSITQDNCDGKTLSKGYSCTVKIDFSPTDIGVEHTTNFEVDYDNGVETKTASSPIEGLSAPPNSTHMGWDQIFAVGNDKDVSGSVTENKNVKLAWPSMAPPSGYSFDHYNVYRASSAEGIDLDSPIKTGVQLTSREFIDTSITPGEIYYYRVQPVIQGAVSQTVESFTTVKVIAPPNNMGLVHRWMANKDTCENMGRTPDKTSNFRCGFDGAGGNGSLFDIGHHLLVDKYELGREADNNHPGQFPHDSITQEDAWNKCTSKTETIKGSTYTKRLIRRKEFVIASAWSEELESQDSSVITKLEEGTPTGSHSNPCNGYLSGEGGVLETGSRSDCVSRYGLYDMVGNIQEHSSERMSGGTQSDDYVLDPNNNDLDGFYFEFDSITDKFFQSESCVNFAMGLVKDSVGSDCLESTEITGANEDLFHAGDVMTTPQSSPDTLIFAPQNGGSFDDNYYSGRWVVNWVMGVGGYAGARCVVEIN